MDYLFTDDLSPQGISLSAGKYIKRPNYKSKTPWKLLNYQKRVTLFYFLKYVYFNLEKKSTIIKLLNGVEKQTETTKSFLLSFSYTTTLEFRTLCTRHIQFP